MLPCRLPMSVKKNVSQCGPAVWPTRGNIYTNVLCNYIDNDRFEIKKEN